MLAPPCTCYLSKNKIILLILCKIHQKEAINNNPKGCNISSFHVLISRYVEVGWVAHANIFSLWAACPLFIRDKQRADCEAAEPGPHAVRGPGESEGYRERKEWGGRRLSDIINLHSLSLQWPVQGPRAAQPCTARTWTGEDTYCTRRGDIGTG